MLGQLKESKSQGADKLHPHLLKSLKDHLCYPLVIIYRKSLEEHKLPSIWKKANVTAIFKSGSKSEACNYRPITLTSVPGKIMEKLFRDKLVDHMTSNNHLVTPNMALFLGDLVLPSYLNILKT